MPRLGIWNALISAYAKSARVADANALLERMPQWNVLSWNSLLSGYASLAVAARSGDACRGSAAVVEAAKDLFDRMPERSIVSLTEMFRLYALLGHLNLARALFDQMPQRDLVAWTSMATAYAKAGNLQQARVVFEDMPLRDEVAWTAVISAFTQNGRMEEARGSFRELPKPCVASWNALIAAHTQRAENRQALLLFKLMDLDGVQADEFTFSSVLDACANLPSLVLGKLVHAEVLARGLSSDAIVVTSLVHLYAKCGLLDKAMETFAAMPTQDAVCWNTMVAACSQNSRREAALDVFRLMVNEGVQPNEVSFRVVLSAMPEYGVMPTLKHYACMVDILGRAGRLDVAQELINNMPFTPDSFEWRTLLAACRVQGNAEQGALAANRLVTSGSDLAAPYLLMSDIIRKKATCCS